MKFKVYKDKQGFWRWRLRAANNEIIASGEAYENKADCLHAISLVKASKDAPVVQAGTAATGAFVRGSK